MSEGFVQDCITCGRPIIKDVRFPNQRRCLACTVDILFNLLAGGDGTTVVSDPPDEAETNEV